MSALDADVEGSDGSAIVSGLGGGFVKAVVGLKTRSGLRWILFRVVSRPLPCTLTLYTDGMGTPR